MKTRDSARKMVEYMRQVNPALAKALTDDRDEVGLQPHSLVETFLTGLTAWQHALWEVLVWGH